MNLTLYNDIKDAKMVEKAWDEMGPEEQSIAIELLVQNAMASVKKISRMCGYQQNRKAFIKNCAAEIDRIKKQMNRAKAIDERLESSILTYMQGKGLDEIEAGTFTLKVQRNPPSAEAVDESLTPAKFKKIEVKYAKEEIGAALKAGEDVPGWKLITDKVHLVVK